MAQPKYIDAFQRARFPLLVEPNGWAWDRREFYSFATIKNWIESGLIKKCGDSYKLTDKGKSYVK